MSPRRWDCDKGGFMFLADEGKWVYWEEHAAALMAHEAAMNLVKQLKDQLATLKTENERIRKYWKVTGEGLNRWVGKSLELEDEVAALKTENATLQAKVAWLMKADRLVCWNGKEWEPRLELREGGGK